MPRALVDTSVLFAAAYKPDHWHDDALPILHGIDDGTLPEAVVIENVLAETLNGLSTMAGHERAVDFLDRLEENTRVHIESFSGTAFVSAKALLRRHEPLSLVDACIVAFMQTVGLDYLYAFDGDFECADHVHRLDTATNPYDSGR